MRTAESICQRSYTNSMHHATLCAGPGLQWRLPGHDAKGAGAQPSYQMSTDTMAAKWRKHKDDSVPLFPALRTVQKRALPSK